MECVLEWLNKNSNALMVIITFVYVIATIVICIANMKSAKATRAQTEEMKRLSIPNIVSEIKILHNEIWVLRFTNLGTLPAYDLNIILSDVFINSLQDPFQSIIKQNNNKRLILKGGGTFDLFYGKEKNPLNDSMPIKGTITYKDEQGLEYKKEFEINAHEYAIVAHMDSEMDMLLKRMNKQTDSIDKIANQLNSINHSLISLTKQDTDESRKE